MAKKNNTDANERPIYRFAVFGWNNGTPCYLIGFDTKRKAENYIKAKQGDSDEKYTIEGQDFRMVQTIMKLDLEDKYLENYIVYYDGEEPEFGIPVDKEMHLQIGDLLIDFDGDNRVFVNTPDVDSLGDYIVLSRTGELLWDKAKELYADDLNGTRV